MKLLKNLMLVAIMALAVQAQAQFTNGSGTSTTNSDVRSYNRFSVSYNNTGVSANKNAGDFDFSLNGVGLEYTHGFSLSSEHPVFIEFGVKARYSLGSYEDDDYEDYSEKYQFLTAIVPLNITYSFAVSENVSIAPFAGLNFKAHILGKQKWEDEEEDSKWYNVFDKEDMGGKDYTYNRFQLGWQVGVGARFEKYYLGLSYGTDFLKIYKHKKASINTGDFVLSLGYCF